MNPNWTAALFEIVPLFCARKLTRNFPVFIPPNYRTVRCGKIKSSLIFRDVLSDFKSTRAAHGWWYQSFGNSTKSRQHFFRGISNIKPRKRTHSHSLARTETRLHKQTRKSSRLPSFSLITLLNEVQQIVQSDKLCLADLKSRTDRVTRVLINFAGWYWVIKSWKPFLSYTPKITKLANEKCTATLIRRTFKSSFPDTPKVKRIEHRANFFRRLILFECDTLSRYLLQRANENIKY